MGHHQKGTDAHELCRLLGPMSIYASCTSHFIALTFTKTNNCKLDIDKTQVISDGAGTRKWEVFQIISSLVVLPHPLVVV